MELTPVIKESFAQYGGAVLQSRALVDARDILKPSARQILYCLYTDKFIHSKPFKKTLKAIGSAFRIYIHGDSSAEGIIMRASQPFAMRYPLIEVEGSYGNLMESSNWSAPRYTSARLSSLSDYLFKDLDKDTISTWRENYDDTEEYPTVLPSKGYYNICNGSYGIGVAASSSIPQYNLKEVNDALIKLLWNPNIDFEEIYCAPDFATGAFLLNEQEVKESHKNGHGKSCKLRSKIEYDTIENCLIVTEIPYMVYTNTICKQLEEIINSENNPGIDRFNDLTGEEPLIKIYLNKKSNPNKVLNYLYKNTSLQSYYSINFTILKDGKYPKVFSWKELLQTHIDHEKEVYRRGFNFDLNKIEERLHIVEGILIAIANIEEVIQTIKSSSSTREATVKLCENFNLSSIQAKSILDMKLSKIAQLEVEKYIKEKEELLQKKQRIVDILSNEILFNKEIENGFIEVSKKFGDNRRTKILNLENEEDEPVEIKNLIINLTNYNNIFTTEISSLYIQKRGGIGNKFKLLPGEYILNSTTIEEANNILLFSKSGKFYSCSTNNIPLNEKIYLGDLIQISSSEKIIAISGINKNKEKNNIIFFTKNGYMKKSLLSEYNTKRQIGVKAIELQPNDEICSVLFSDNDNIGILTKNSQFIMFNVEKVNSIGRVAKGIKAIKLEENDYVISVKIIPKTTKEIASVTKLGYSKRTLFSEFSLSNRYTKGIKIQKFKNDEDEQRDFIPISNEKELIFISTNSQIKIKKDEIGLSGKSTMGVKTINLKNSKEQVIGISVF